MTNQVIPEAAAEAAARALLSIDALRFPWSDLTDEARERSFGNLRIALEAAAPHMRQAFYLEMNLRAVEAELKTPLR